MALPKGIEPKTREAWLELAKSSDATARKQVTDCLRELGLGAPEYMPMQPEQRVDYIMKHQEEAPAASTASTSTSSTKKDKASVSGGGGGGMTAADRALLQETRDAVVEMNALLKKVHDLLVVQVFTDPQVKSNAEELGVKVDLLGNG